MAARAKRGLLDFVSASIFLFPRSSRPRVAVVVPRVNLVPCLSLLLCVMRCGWRPAAFLPGAAFRCCFRFFLLLVPALPAAEHPVLSGASRGARCALRHRLALIAFCSACSTPAWRNDAD